MGHRWTQQNEVMKLKRPTKACLCASLTVWILLAMLTLITTSMVYLKPLLKVISYKRASCRVENVFYTTQYVCSCGEDCNSYYPCFMIHVSINLTSSQSWTVILYSDTEQQSIVNHSSRKRRENCSLMVCKDDPQKNRDQVAIFQEQYGVRGNVVECYYAPWDIKGGAVLSRIHPGIAALHAVLWPLMCLIIGVGLCVIFCKKCRQIEHLTDSDSKANDGESATALNCQSNSSRTPIIMVPPDNTSNCLRKAERKAPEIGKKRKQRSLRSLWMDT